MSENDHLSENRNGIGGLGQTENNYGFSNTCLFLVIYNPFAASLEQQMSHFNRWLHFWLESFSPCFLSVKHKSRVINTLAHISRCLQPHNCTRLFACLRRKCTNTSLLPQTRWVVAVPNQASSNVTVVHHLGGKSFKGALCISVQVELGRWPHGEGLGTRIT